MRGVMGLLAFFAFVSIFSHRLSIAFVINVMKSPSNLTDVESKHQNCKDIDEEVIDVPRAHNAYHPSNWSDRFESFMAPCFFIGYTLTQIPGGVLADLYGAKWVLSVGILVSSFTAMLMPIAIRNGLAVTITFRILMGAAQGPISPSTISLLSTWVPKRERATLSTLAYSGVPMGVVLTGFSSAYLLNNFEEWDITHYLFGSMGLLCFLLFVSGASSHPNNHPCIRPEEVVFLNEQIKTYKISLNTIPWKAIMQNKPMISVIVGQMGHKWGFNIMISGLPNYIKRVIRISTKENGFLMCLPYMAMFVWTNLAGMLADWVVKTKTMEVATQRKLYTLLAAICPGAFTLFASFAECQKFLVVSFLAMAVITSGFYYSGLRLSPMDLSESYSGTLMGISNGVGDMASVCCVIVTRFMTPHDSLEEWRNVFWLSFLILTITALGFVKWGSADVQPFDPSYAA